MKPFLALAVLLSVLSLGVCAESIVYAFDEVEVLYAARFTIYPTETSLSSWAEGIAAPGEDITVTYGIVVLKSTDPTTGELREAVREEFLKVGGSLGSKRLLSNSASNSFNSEGTLMTASKTQLWSAKKLVGNNIEKDFTEPVYNAYLFRKLVEGEMAPAFVCFRMGANFDDFWGKTNTDDCYTTRAFLKEVGENKETSGSQPPNATPIPRSSCLPDYSCLSKSEGVERGCVVLGSFQCENEPNEYCFKCPPVQAPTPTIQPTPTPEATPTPETTPSPTPEATPTPSVGIANPASENCVKLGAQSTIITLPSGDQGGLCVFANGTMCEEWALYKGEGCTLTCEQYCVTQPHIQCVGIWNITGTYPQCSCNFSCS